MKYFYILYFYFNYCYSIVFFGFNLLVVVVLEDFMKFLWVYRRKEFIEIEVIFYLKLFGGFIRSFVIVLNKE